MNMMTEFDEITGEERVFFSVVHPLDDAPEEKIATEHMGPMRMTKTVRVCLLALRGYLLLMFTLLGYRVFELARGLNS